MTQLANQPEQTNRFHCGSCGADLLFEPKDGCLTCPYCGHCEMIPQNSSEIIERPFEQFLTPQQTQLERIATDALQVQCTSCGATVAFTPPEVARLCDFCGAAIVAQPKAADPIVAPEAVRALGAEVTVINATPNGTNINAECGSTFPSEIQRVVKESGAKVD